jgi:hypothetical protein
VGAVYKQTSTAGSADMTSNMRITFKSYLGHPLINTYVINIVNENKLVKLSFVLFSMSEARPDLQLNVNNVTEQSTAR